MKRLPTALVAITAITAIALLNACDELTVDRDDVVRFDYTISASDSLFTLSDTLVKPYETEELKDYKDDRDKIEDYVIQKVEFRLFNFRQDHPDTRIQGTCDITSDLGTVFQVELFEIGDEYKDTQNHEVHSITANGEEGDAAYDLLAQEVVAADQFYVSTANLGGVVDSLDCDLSIYIHYHIKSQ